MGQRIIVKQDVDMLTILFDNLETQTIYFNTAEDAKAAAGMCERLETMVLEMDLGDKFVSGYQQLLKEALVEYGYAATVV